MFQKCTGRRPGERTDHMPIVLPTDHLSPSQVGMYTKCGEQYRRRYVEGERRPPEVAMLVGRGVHGGAEGRHRRVMDTGEEMPRADVVDLAVAVYDGDVDEAGEVDLGAEADRGTDIVIGEARDRTATLAGCFADKVAPQIRYPIAVEEQIEIPVERLGISLLGYLDVAHEREDLVAYPEGDSAVIVEDLKTGTKTRSQADVDGDRQLSWYAMGWRHRTGTLPHGVGIRQVLSQKRGPKAVLVESQRTDDHVAALLKTINAVAVGISAGVFPPAPDGAWWCSARWCGYYSTCPYVVGKVIFHE